MNQHLQRPFFVEEYDNGLTREFDREYYAAKELHLRSVYERRYGYRSDSRHEEFKDTLRQKIGKDWDYGFHGYKYIGKPYDYDDTEGIIMGQMENPVDCSNSEDYKKWTEVRIEMVWKISIS